MARIVYVVKDECISCGLCVGSVPGGFRFGDGGKAEAYDPAGAPEDTIQAKGIDICPVSCISWQ